MAKQNKDNEKQKNDSIKSLKYFVCFAFFVFLLHLFIPKITNMSVSSQYKSVILISFDFHSR